MEPGQDFRPTRAQRRLYAAAMDLPPGARLRWVLGAARVSRSSYYRWCAQAGFQEWLAQAGREGCGLMAQVGAVHDLSYLQRHADKARCFRPAFEYLMGNYGLGSLDGAGVPLHGTLLAAQARLNRLMEHCRDAAQVHRNAAASRGRRMQRA